MKFGLGESGLWITVWVFGWAVVWYFQVRESNRKRLRVLDLIHKERLHAMDRGLTYPELPPYRIDEQAAREPGTDPWQKMAAYGVVVLLTGAGCVAALFLVQAPDLHSLWPLGSIPCSLGAGLLACAFFFRRIGISQ